jgi:hypothetical protein
MEDEKNLSQPALKWYHYLSAFFAGFFLANTVPHFIHGVSGDSFPTPFANPPGKGLSSPIVNTLWACLNLLIGYILLRAGRVSYKNKIMMLVLFVGILAVSIMLSMAFADKAKA